MKELLRFFTQHSKWFVLVIYLVLSGWLLCERNPYQHHLWLTSANAISSSVYETAHNVTSYFNLRDINEDLQHRNAMLLQENVALKDKLLKAQEQLLTESYAKDSVDHFEVIIGHVINNSLARPFNYLTINKGANDGIHPETGVIDQNGVVGIVNVVGPHMSRVISLLNKNFRLSCKVKNDQTFGSLIWDCTDPTIATLEQLPRHAVFQVGDTVVTSGYSDVFPEGVPVGTIVSGGDDPSASFYELKVKLFTDFSTLSTVQIIVSNFKEELNALRVGEQEAEQASIKQRNQGGGTN